LLAAGADSLARNENIKFPFCREQGLKVLRDDDRQVVFACAPGRAGKQAFVFLSAA
jgi:hypothetical protein